MKLCFIAHPTTTWALYQKQRQVNAYFRIHENWWLCRFRVRSNPLTLLSVILVSTWYIWYYFYVKLMLMKFVFKLSHYLTNEFNFSQYTNHYKEKNIKIVHFIFVHSLYTIFFWATCGNLCIGLHSLSNRLSSVRRGSHPTTTLLDITLTTRIKSTAILSTYHSRAKCLGHIK